MQLRDDPARRRAFGGLIFFFAHVGQAARLSCESEAREIRSGLRPGCTGEPPVPRKSHGRFAS